MSRTRSFPSYCGKSRAFSATDTFTKLRQGRRNNQKESMILRFTHTHSQCQSMVYICWNQTTERSRNPQWRDQKMLQKFLDVRSSPWVALVKHLNRFTKMSLSRASSGPGCSFSLGDHSFTTSGCKQKSVRSSVRARGSQWGMPYIAALFSVYHCRTGPFLGDQLFKF